MAFKKEDFNLSGPLHLTTVDWNNSHHRRSVAASLVQGVYILERDRQQNRQGPHSLASPWWEFFHFQLLSRLTDDVDSSIFGAIYEYKLPSHESPRYVVALRGTIRKPDTVSRDLQLGLHVIQNGLQHTSRFEIAMQSVRSMVASGQAQGLNIWLAGHSLGSAMAMLAGKTMAKMGILLESFLFNPPFVSAPIDRIKNKKIKHGIRIASSLITAGLSVAVKGNLKKNLTKDNSFVVLSDWVPCLFVNPADHICSEYIGYFEHRKKMEEIGAGGIERFATQNSIGGLFLSAMGKESDLLHLIPSANLTVNLTPSADFKTAHGIHQWWRPDFHLQSKLYKYK